jgi:hypothetical protein
MRLFGEELVDGSSIMMWWNKESYDKVNKSLRVAVTDRDTVSNVSTSYV